MAKQGCRMITNISALVFNFHEKRMIPANISTNVTNGGLGFFSAHAVTTK
ncbi:MAG: hypothetical protein PF481_10435 [Bacteroidales bacterium]|nr:hypothetical protein [Bacteroidales bacterium]